MLSIWQVPSAGLTKTDLGLAIFVKQLVLKTIVKIGLGS